MGYKGNVCGDERETPRVWMTLWRIFGLSIPHHPHHSLTALLSRRPPARPPEPEIARFELPLPPELISCHARSSLML